MGIYEQKGFKPKVNLRLRQLKYVILAAAVLIAVAALLPIAQNLLQPKPLKIILEPNPLDLTKAQNSYLTAIVKNTTSETATNIVVRVRQIAGTALDIFPSERTIDSLAPGEYRELSPFSIRPNPLERIYSGSYDLNVSVEMNGLGYSEKATLQIKAV